METSLSQISAELERLQPSELVIAESANFSAAGTTTRRMPDWQFDLDSAQRLLAKQFGTSDLKGFGCDDMPVAIAAAGALLQYVQQTQRGVLPHLACADAKQRINLVAVVDAVAERAKQSAEKFGVPRWFSNMDDMLAQTDVDMVLVITPIQYHFENAMTAIATGKHVYVQKSMTTTEIGRAHV